MPEDQPKTTHAQRRRKESQEALRRRLRGTQFIRRLKEIADRVLEVEAGQVPALRLQADIYMRLLGKVLPDLKAIEHSGQIERPADVSDKPMSAADWAAQAEDYLGTPAGTAKASN